MFIHWEPGYDTGQPLVDAEHRLLVFLFRKLDVAIKTHRPDQHLRQIVLEVRRFVEFHFVSEENLMRETEYPGFESHRAVHVKLVNELDVFIAKLVEQREYPEDLLAFLNNWLIEHIAKHDQQVAKHVRDAANRPVAELAYPEYLARANSTNS